MSYQSIKSSLVSRSISPEKLVSDCLALTTVKDCLQIQSLAPGDAFFHDSQRTGTGNQVHTSPIVGANHDGSLFQFSKLAGCAASEFEAHHCLSIRYRYIPHGNPARSNVPSKLPGHRGCGHLFQLRRMQEINAGEKLPFPLFALLPT